MPATRTPKPGVTYHAYPAIDGDGNMRIDVEPEGHSWPVDEVWAEPGQGAAAAIMCHGYQLVRWTSTDPTLAHMIVRYIGA